MKSASATSEFAVRRRTFDRFFDPPISRSTFFDLVKSGKIVPVEGLRGFYKLNASLTRLGLNAVSTLPADLDIPVNPCVLAQEALATCMPDEITHPPELLDRDLTNSEMLQLTLLTRVFNSEIRNLPDPQQRLNFAQGALDAAGSTKARGYGGSFCQDREPE